MENNKSDILSERKRAQQSFLNLKKVQKGELPPEKREEEKVPKTFKEKIVNFWFHYKVHSILAVFFAVVLAIGITQCSTQEKYDGRVALYTRNHYTNAEIEFFKDYLTPYFTDTDGDGKVNIQIIDCSYTTEGSFDLNYTSALATRLQSIISSEGDVQLFITTPDTLEQLNSVSEQLPEFFVENIAFNEEIYNMAKEQGISLPNNLMLGRRAISGTLIGELENIDEYVSKAQQIMDEFKKRHTP